MSYTTTSKAAQMVQDLRDAGATTEQIISLGKIFKARRMIHGTTQDWSDQTDVPARRVAHLVKRFGHIIGAEYTASDYAPSGAGAFGHRNPSVAGAGGYSPATVSFDWRIVKK